MLQHSRRLVATVSFALVLLTGCSASQSQSPADGVIAFVNVNVIPMDSERVLANQTVLIRDGRIAEMGPDVSIPRGAQQVDGQGRYLMPGLIDMAVYGLDDHDHLPYMMHGVTTIRHARGATLQLKWREDAMRGDMIGPYVYNTRNMVDDAVEQLGPVVEMPSPDDAERIIKLHTDNGYDALRVTHSINRENYFALVEAAGKVGLPIIGNVPKEVGLDEISDRTIIDYSRLVMEMQPSDTLFDEVNITFGLPAAAYWTMDEERMDDVIQIVKRQNLRVVPINAASYWGYRYETAEALDEVLADPRLAYYRPENSYYWKNWYERAATPRRIATAKNAMEVRKRLTAALHEAGVTLLMGSRNGHIGLLPGEAAHEDVYFFVEAGLTPYEALRTATFNAAEELKAMDEIGTIAVGKQADLMLLAANPLEDIRNLATQEGVMGDGFWYPQTEMQAQLEARAKFYEQEGHFMSILEDNGYEAARAHYLDFRQENPDQELFREMRLLNYIYDLVGAQERYDEALGVLDFWEEVYPNSWLVLSLYGYTYDNMGQIDKAIEAYDYAWETNPYGYNFSVKEEAAKLREKKAEGS